MSRSSRSNSSGRRNQSSWTRGGGSGGDVFSLLSSHPETNPDGRRQSRTNRDSRSGNNYDSKWVKEQESTFIQWLNHHLKASDHQMSISDLRTGLQDGLALIELMKIVAPGSIQFIKYHKNPRLRLLRLENVQIALECMKREGIQLLNIEPADIVDGNLKLTLGLLQSLANKYPITAGGNVPHKPLTRKAMLLWLQVFLPKSDISNFTTDWNDGILLCTLVDKLRPGHIPNLRSLNSANAVENTTLAMDIAEKHLDVPKVVSPESLCERNPKELSVTTYLSYFCGPESPGHNYMIEWVNDRLPDHQVINFSRDWLDGVVLCYLVDSFYPYIHDEETLMKQSPSERVKLAMETAEMELDVKGTMRSTQFISENADQLMRMAYITQFMKCQRKDVEYQHSSLKTKKEVPESIIEEAETKSKESTEDSSSNQVDAPIESAAHETQEELEEVSNLGSEELSNIESEEPFTLESGSSSEFESNNKYNSSSINKPTYKYEERKISKEKKEREAEIEKEMEADRAKRDKTKADLDELFAAVELDFDNVLKQIDNIGTLKKSENKKLPNDAGGKGGSETQKESVVNPSTAQKEDPVELDLDFDFSSDTVTSSDVGSRPQSPTPDPPSVPLPIRNEKVEEIFQQVVEKDTIVESAAPLETAEHKEKKSNEAAIPEKEMESPVDMTSEQQMNELEDIVSPESDVTNSQSDDPHSDILEDVADPQSNNADLKSNTPDPDLESDTDEQNKETETNATPTNGDLDKAADNEENTTKPDAVCLIESDNENVANQTDHGSIKNQLDEPSTTGNDQNIDDENTQEDLREETTSPVASVDEEVITSDVHEEETTTPPPLGEITDDDDGDLHRPIRTRPIRQPIIAALTEAPAMSQVSTTTSPEPMSEHSSRSSPTVSPSASPLPLSLSTEEDNADTKTVTNDSSSHSPLSNPHLCKVSGRGLYYGIVDQRGNFVVDCSLAGRGRLEVIIESPTGENLEADGEQVKESVFRVFFTPTEVGIHKISVLFHNKDVPNSPFSCDVSDPSACFTIGQGPSECSVGKDQRFQVNTEDAGQGTLLTTFSGSEQPVDFQLVSCVESVYTYQYSVQKAGEYEIEVKWVGEHIPGSPFKVIAKDNGPYPMECIILEQPLENIRVRDEIKVKVDCQSAGLGELKALLISPRGEVSCHIAIENGIYTVTTRPSDVGDHRLVLQYSGDDIPDSPVMIHVNDPSLVKLNIQPNTPQSVSLNKLFSFHVNTEKCGEGHLSAIAITSDAPNRPIDLNVEQDASGFGYTVSYRPRSLGIHAIQVLYDNKPCLGTPISLKVKDLDSNQDIVLTKTLPAQSSQSLLKRMISFQLCAPNRDPADISFTAVGINTGEIPQLSIVPTVENIYSLEFKALKPDEYKISVTYKGEHVQGSPFTIPIRPPVHANKVTMYDPVIPLVSSKPIELVFDTSQAGHGILTASVLNSEKKSMPLYVEQVNDDIYRVAFIPRESGSFMVSVQYAEKHIGGSPFRVLYQEQTKEPPVVIYFEPDMKVKGLMGAAVYGRNSGRQEATVVQYDRCKYQISFHPQSPDTFDVHVYWFDTEVEGSPFEIDLLGMENESSDALVDSVPIVLEDKIGMLAATAAGHKSGPVPIKLTPTENCICNIEFTSPGKDKFDLSVFWNGRVLSGMPIVLPLD